MIDAMISDFTSGFAEIPLMNIICARSIDTARLMCMMMRLCLYNLWITWEENSSMAKCRQNRLFFSFLLHFSFKPDKNPRYHKYISTILNISPIT